RRTSEGRSPASEPRLVRSGYCDPLPASTNLRAAGIKDSDRGHAGPFSARKTGGVMQKALRAIVILGVLGVLEAVVFVPVFATAQAVKPTNKVACCFLENGAPTCGQLTADNCAKHNGTSLGAISCAHNPCLSSSTTTSTTGAATTTTSSAAPTTTTSSAAPTTTTSSAAPTTTTSSAAPTTTTSSAAPTTTTSSAAPTTTTARAAPTTTTTSTTATTTSSTTSSTSSTTATTTSSTTTTTTSLAPCAPIVTGQPISGTYQTTSLGPTDAAAVKVCTTNSTANRFAICTDDTFCGGAAGSGLCAQTPWVDAGGVTQPTPTATTTFTVTAGSPPTCEHTVCIQCGAIDKCADIQGGCDNCEIGRAHV